MSKIKVIKNEKDYEEALQLVERLMIHDPDPDSEEGEKLNLLSTLIKDYESKILPEELPSPIDAIRFRMEQTGLKPIDLTPYIGSRSRVSEILSGKRQLTLDMVRALSEGLGIPAEVLIQKYEPAKGSEYETWDNRLVREMEKRGYFGKLSLKTHSKVDMLKNFFSVIGTPTNAIGLTRKSSYRSSPLTDKKALRAWATRVIQKAKKIKVSKKYKHGSLDLKFMREMAQLSVLDDNPIKAQELLLRHGIILLVEPHFSKTYLDGATILINKDNPVVGLTLRHDRLDNFWFTLMHELAHISLHYDKDVTLFYDEIEGVRGVEINSIENEADQMAREALVPSSKWESSPAKLIPSPMAAQSLANELDVHVAIVAGVMRYEHKNFYYLNKIVNSYKVKVYFSKQLPNK